MTDDNEYPRSTIKADSRRIMDDYVTLRLMLMLSLAGVGVMSSLLGFLWSEVIENRQNISEVPGLVAELIQEDNEFHVEQRGRLWDRVNEVQGSLTAVDRNQARLEGRIEQMIKSLERVVERLDNFNTAPPPRGR